MYHCLVVLAVVCNNLATIITDFQPNTIIIMIIIIIIIVYFCA